MKPAKTTMIKPEHKELLEKIGLSVKELRTGKQIKIKKIVEEINMHRNAYSQLENGKTYFKISSLLKILDFHNVNYYDFLKKIDGENQRVGTKKLKNL
ncbi:MAG: helix-turn-helix domain-containing protein [Bacteroidales bacterium]|jgi:transcriptional regulator with XRE-family HTH domain